MTAAGQSTPNPEFPTEAQRQAYGDLCFLYFRSPARARYTVAQMRLLLQPAVDLEFCKVFRFDEVARYAITWAFFSPEVEKKFIAGEPVLPAEWRSGSQMWVVETIAPYEQGSAFKAVRWLMDTLPPEIESFRYLRPQPERGRLRAVELRRRASGRWAPHVIYQNVTRATLERAKAPLS